MNARKNFTPPTGKTRFPIPSALAVAVTAAMAVLSGIAIPALAETGERDDSTIVVEAKDAEAVQGRAACRRVRPVPGCWAKRMSWIRRLTSAM
ncbi:hypothetical protein QX227_04840 [Pectobacterium aroidearum]|uniref:hypothetical protein n=1 Tax=Pectobacterium aroidearum TaxID=1201031 RepID=UPI002FC7E2B9